MYKVENYQALLTWYIVLPRALQFHVLANTRGQRYRLNLRVIAAVVIRTVYHK